MNTEMGQIVLSILPQNKVSVEIPVEKSADSVKTFVDATGYLRYFEELLGEGSHEYFSDNEQVCRDIQKYVSYLCTKTADISVKSSYEFSDPGIQVKYRTMLIMLLESICTTVSSLSEQIEEFICGYDSLEDEVY